MRHTGPRNKISRRFGISLFGPASKSLERRLRQPPGGRPGARPRKLSEYAVQLREKQKVRFMYGMTEAQFRRFYEMAERGGGEVGPSLLQLLERRLDNVVYRLGFARTRPMARQLVSHGHIQVNGRRVNIPSYLIKAGDEIALTQKVLQTTGVQEALEDTKGLVPVWLAREDGKGRIVRLPSMEDVEAHINPALIVAYYTR